MQNISYVYSIAGRSWVDGLKPAKNVGANVASELEELIAEVEGQRLLSDAEFKASVDNKVSTKKVSKPKGNPQPKRKEVASTQFERNPDVVAWVLLDAADVCESCGKGAPFVKEDGNHYLEVHHLKPLSDGGSDSVENAVALCPNCHREFHYGRDNRQKLDEAYQKVARLVRE